MIDSGDGILMTPRKRPHEILSLQGLIDLIMKEKMCAGSNMIIDLVAAKITERSGIPLVVIDGRDPALIEKALLKGEFAGTIVGDSLIRFPIV